jgi:hypothetical protein
MWTLCMSYDLRQPGRDYSNLTEYLKTFPNWCHALESMWFVVTDKSPEAVRDEARKCADANDRLLVFRTGPPAAWVGLSNEITEWLQKNL